MLFLWNIFPFLWLCSLVLLGHKPRQNLGNLPQPLPPPPPPPSSRIQHTFDDRVNRWRDARMLLYISYSIYIVITAIRMTYLWRVFHTPSWNNTKLWPVKNYWLECPCLGRFLSIHLVPFFLMLIKSSATDLKCFGQFNWKEVPLVKTKLDSSIGVQ